MRTLTEQYRSVKEGKGPKDVFLKEAKRQFPNLVTNAATFKEASTILKQKGIISENYVDLKPINNPIERKKEGFENAFANFLAEAEAKAEEKKVSKEVEEDASKNYDTSDKKDPNNMIFGQIQMGYYYEMKQEKNADKTIDEIKDIVFKNLAKDPIYYTKNGQFGVEVGYTDDNIALGVPEEPKGEYKSSGYGKLKENKILDEAVYQGVSNRIQLKKFSQGLEKKGASFYNELINPKTPSYKKQKMIIDLIDSIPGGRSFESDRQEYKNDFPDGREGQERAIQFSKALGDYVEKENLQSKIKENKKPVNEIAIAGGLVTGGGFTSANYKDFFGLNEADDDAAEAAKVADEAERAKAAVDAIAGTKMFEAEGPIHIEALVDAAEAAYDAGMSTDEILEFIEQHLGLKMRE